MLVEESKEVVRRFVEEILNRGDMSVVPQLVAEEFVEQFPMPGQPPGREGLIANVATMRSAFADVEWVIEELLAEGHKVASSGFWKGTHNGVFFGIPATGKPVTVPFMAIDDVVDGKLKVSRLIMDIMALMQQLGAVGGSGQ